VSPPRKQPRHFAEDPTAFGKSLHIAWNEASDDQALLFAAKVHNQFSYRIRLAIQWRRPPVSVEAYARAVGATYGQLSRVLRGEAGMSVRDIAAAKAYFGDQIDLNIPILATPSALDSWAEAARGAEPDDSDDFDEFDSEADW